MKKPSKKKSSTKKSSKKKTSTKKPSKKKSTAKKKKKTPQSARKPASASAAKAKGSGAPINKQPQVKEQAAVANGMFLYTDDAWSQRYFDQNDLHFKEREVFG